jgi:hypothetical protein
MPTFRVSMDAGLPQPAAALMVENGFAGAAGDYCSG